MKVMEKTIPEITEKLKTMSPFLKMEYLEECAKQNIDFSIKRFCNQKLAELYAERNMFSQSAKNMESAAEMAVTYKDKIQLYTFEISLWIKAGDYDRADETLQKSLACANAKEKEEIKKKAIQMYRKQAIVFEKLNKNSHALRIYEKLLRMVSEAEKLEIKKKILPLYRKLGKIREYTILEEQIGKNV